MIFIASNKHSRARIGGLLALLVFALLLPSCAITTLAYNQAPSLIYWYLDSYVDFNRTQSLQVKEHLAVLQDWHRQSQLPAYVETLRKLKAQVPEDMTARQVCDVLSDVKGKVVSTADRFAPAVATLATSLTPEQLTHMGRMFEKGNATYRDDFIETSPNRSRTKRYKDAVSRAEKLYGSLNAKQLEIVRRSIDESRFDPKLEYAENLRRQRDVIQTLRSTHTFSPEEARAPIQGFFERSVYSPDLEYREYVEIITQDSCRNIADLHNSTSSEQRQKAIDVLADYEWDFTILSHKKK